MRVKKVKEFENLIERSSTTDFALQCKRSMINFSDYTSETDSKQISGKVASLSCIFRLKEPENSNTVDKVHFKR